MGKQTVFLSVFFVFGLFLNPLQAANLDDFEICPNPNFLPEDLAVINPMAPKETNQGVEVEANNEASDDGIKVLEVGYTCKVPTVETKSYRNGEEGDVYVQWTLVKKERDGEIWAAHTGRWGSIYMGGVEHISSFWHTFDKAKEVCNKTEEFVFNGEVHRVKMTLPKIGFGKGDSDVDNPLNFELLKYLNYVSVVSIEDRDLFWSSSLNGDFAWVHPVHGTFLSEFKDFAHLVRCVGLPEVDE